MGNTLSTPKLLGCLSMLTGRKSSPTSNCCTDTCEAKTAQRPSALASSASSAQYAYRTGDLGPLEHRLRNLNPPVPQVYSFKSTSDTYGDSRFRVFKRLFGGLLSLFVQQKPASADTAARAFPAKHPVEEIATAEQVVSERRLVANSPYPTKWIQGASNSESCMQLIGCLQPAAVVGGTAVGNISEISSKLPPQCSQHPGTKPLKIYIARNYIIDYSIPRLLNTSNGTMVSEPIAVDVQLTHHIFVIPRIVVTDCEPNLPTTHPDYGAVNEMKDALRGGVFGTPAYRLWGYWLPGGNIASITSSDDDDAGAFEKDGQNSPVGGSETESDNKDTDSESDYISSGSESGSDDESDSDDSGSDSDSDDDYNDDDMEDCGIDIVFG